MDTAHPPVPRPEPPSPVVASSPDVPILVARLLAVAVARPALALPAVPADLAAERPIAAALVRAGAPTAEPRPPRRRRRRPAAPAAAGPTTSPARRDRLLAQLGERARAADRAARRLAQARRAYDRAATPAARTAADATLREAAAGHERALAACRALARQLGDHLTAPGLAEARAGRGRAR
jgi:hypothetical protein